MSGVVVIGGAEDRTGSKTVLGFTGNWNGDDVIDIGIIAVMIEQPEHLFACGDAVEDLKHQIDRNERGEPALFVFGHGGPSSCDGSALHEAAPTTRQGVSRPGSSRQARSACGAP